VSPKLFPITYIKYLDTDPTLNILSWCRGEELDLTSKLPQRQGFVSLLPGPSSTRPSQFSSTRRGVCQ
jgi:hypothetical protein